MDKPTKAQRKEFWERCGLYFKTDKDGTVYSYESYPSGDFIDIGYPDLDLNNLFKYAMPKVKEKGYMVDLCLIGSIQGGWLCRLHKGYFPNETFAKVTDENPALALFWAIWEVIHNGQRS